MNSVQGKIPLTDANTYSRTFFMKIIFMKIVYENNHNRRFNRGHGKLCPNFDAVGLPPRPVNPNREVATFYIFVPFLSMERPKDDHSISGLKPLIKLDLGYLTVRSIMHDTDKCQVCHHWSSWVSTEAVASCVSELPPKCCCF